jgi:hypothetical protein
MKNVNKISLENIAFHLPFFYYGHYFVVKVIYNFSNVQFLGSEKNQKGKHNILQRLFVYCRCLNWWFPISVHRNHAYWNQEMLIFFLCSLFSFFCEVELDFLFLVKRDIVFM